MSHEPGHSPHFTATIWVALHLATLFFRELQLVFFDTVWLESRECGCFIFTTEQWLSMVTYDDVDAFIVGYSSCQSHELADGPSTVNWYHLAGETLWLIGFGWWKLVLPSQLTRFRPSPTNLEGPCRKGSHGQQTSPRTPMTGPPWLGPHDRANHGFLARPWLGWFGMHCFGFITRRATFSLAATGRIGCKKDGHQLMFMASWCHWLPVDASDFSSNP